MKCIYTVKEFGLYPEVNGKTEVFLQRSDILKEYSIYKVENGRVRTERQHLIL